MSQSINICVCVCVRVCDRLHMESSITKHTGSEQWRVQGGKLADTETRRRNVENKKKRQEKKKKKERYESEGGEESRPGN